MKVITGQAPNLPWWKIQNMSDKEIKYYNSKFLVEIEMKDEPMFPSMQSIEQLKKDIWNAAIEEAAKSAELNIDDCEIHNLIRKLKK